MAFPWLSEEGFESGGTVGSLEDTTHFDASSDTQGKLSIIHYSELAGIPGAPAPYRGAYCLRLEQTGTVTTAAYLQETGSWDLSASGSIFFRFALFIGSGITMSNGNQFDILQLWSGASTSEVAIHILYQTSGGLQIGIGDGTVTSRYLPISTNVWHIVEAKFVIDSGGGDGTADLWLDGGHATQVTGMTQNAITSGIFGAVGIDAGSTVLPLYFDELIADDAQLYPIKERFPESLTLTKSGHAFVGPGTIDNVTLMSGAGTDNVLQLYDTDVANVNDAQSFKIELKNTAQNELVDPAGVPVHVQRGAYISLSGTNPRANVLIRSATGYGSDGAIRSLGVRRTQSPI